jgi:hypothetical protein
MNSIVDKFSEGRKIIRRISLDEMEQQWSECVKLYGADWTIKNPKDEWIEAIKNPSWSPNIIWDEEEGNWIEFEDWLDSQL